MNNSVSNDIPDKEYLYGRYQENTDKRAEQALKDREWQSQLHKQLSHKALDEPMLDDEMGDIYAPKKITNTGLGGKELFALAAIALPMMGLSGAGVTLLINQWMSQQNDKTPVVQPAPEKEPGDMVVPKLRFGPEREGGR